VVIIKYPNGILRPEITSYQVVAIDERYKAMNDSYNDADYGEAINYARSMIESACKYVFKILNDREITEGYISLRDLIKKTLRTLNSELSQEDSVTDISDELIKIVNKIGDLRNQTSVSHGSSVRTKSITAIEARFVIFAAENITVTLLDLLFNKTHSLKYMAVGSVIDKSGLKLYEGDSSDLYKRENGDSFSVFPGNDIIYQVDITLPESTSFSNDKELYLDHIRSYMEDDAEEVIKKGEQMFEFYSKKKDFKYDVQVDKNRILITKLEE
jgi:hypothetical protein